MILDDTVVRVRLDRKATSISLLVVLGMRQDGQKVLLAIKQMGVERTERLADCARSISSSAACGGPNSHRRWRRGS